MQAAQGVSASHGALVIIFDQIASFFKRLEEHAKVSMTDAMKDIMVEIMVGVLEIFAIMTKEINKGFTSEPISGDMFLVADRDSEKLFDNLIGRKDIVDALSKLDRLTQKGVYMAITQILNLTTNIKGGVEAVGVGVEVVGKNLNQFIEGTSACYLLTIPSQSHKRLDGKEKEARMEEEKR